MSLRMTALPVAIHRFPRVSGDEPAGRRRAVEHGWFSPRERG